MTSDGKKESNEKNKILIVEDSPTQAEKLRYVLEQQDFNISVARNGREGLDMARKHKPNLIVSDIVMPELTGYQLCLEIKKDEELKYIPVILLTQLSDPADVIRGLECGADNFSIKPYADQSFDETYLLSKIEYLLKNPVQPLGVMKGLELTYEGERYVMNTTPQQLFNFLISAYESAVYQNHKLTEIQQELKRLQEMAEKL